MLIVLIIDYVYCLLVFVVVGVKEVEKFVKGGWDSENYYEVCIDVGLNLWFIGGICDICYFGVVFIWLNVFGKVWNLYVDLMFGNNEIVIGFCFIGNRFIFIFLFVYLIDMMCFFIGSFFVCL